MPPPTAVMVTATAAVAAERPATSLSPSSPRTRLLPRLHLLSPATVCTTSPATVASTDIVVASSVMATASRSPSLLSLSPVANASRRLRKSSPPPMQPLPRRPPPPKQPATAPTPPPCPPPPSPADTASCHDHHRRPPSRFGRGGADLGDTATVAAEHLAATAITRRRRRLLHSPPARIWPPRPPLIAGLHDRHQRGRGALPAPDPPAGGGGGGEGPDSPPARLDPARRRQPHHHLHPRSAISIPTADGPQHPTQLAITVAVATSATVAFLATSRHPARSGRSGADLAGTAAAASVAEAALHLGLTGAPPRFSSEERRPRHHRPWRRVALPVAAWAAARWRGGGGGAVGARCRLGRGTRAEILC
ncbi:hypothetical protein DAI22_06g095950 [Oryza sativa Japonica Group]|nr:hypothetical protein DAI22_06g095950 [Oryza sativa Japonica Group]